MLPVFKPTVELKICGYLPQSSVRGLALDPEPLKVPYNQISNKPLCFTGHGVAFGARVLVRTGVALKAYLRNPITRL